MPIARIRPNRVTVLMDIPMNSSTAKVATRDTGMAMVGISAERQLPRNTKVTATTRATACSSEMTTCRTAAET